MPDMKIPQFAPSLGLRELLAVAGCFKRNWITEGPASKSFEARLLELTGARHGVFAPNGTLGLYLALVALDIGPGDEVIVPDFSFFASASAVLMTGAKPVFCDIQDDLHLDLQHAEELIGPAVKAIMPVHIYGSAADMCRVGDFASKHGLRVVEDAAQGIGVTWNSKHVGTFGDVGVFSFFADKTITTGEGAFIVTDSEELFTHLKFLRNQGRLDRGSFVHPQIGYNFRMTDIQCAIGNVQIARLEKIKADKARILETYRKYLNDEVHIYRPSVTSKSNHIPFRVSVNVGANRDKAIEGLRSDGIEPRTFFAPLRTQPALIDKQISQDTSRDWNSDRHFREGVCLPSWVGIPDRSIKKVALSVLRHVQ
jgi:perosamine synthetase